MIHWYLNTTHLCHVLITAMPETGFFTIKNIYRLKLKKDLRDTFVIEYLRKVDISTALVTVVYGLKRN